jgi:hypothetical protein
MARILLPYYLASITEDNLFVRRHEDFQSQSNRQSSSKHTQLITLFVKVSLKEHQKQPRGMTLQLAKNLTPPLDMQTIKFLILLLF